MIAAKTTTVWNAYKKMLDGSEVFVASANSETWVRAFFDDYRSHNRKCEPLCDWDNSPVIKKVVY